MYIVRMAHYENNQDETLTGGPLSSNAYTKKPYSGANICFLLSEFIDKYLIG